MQSRGASMALSIITGLLMIVLGGLFLAQPGLSLATVIWLVGIFAIVYGLLLAIAGIAGRHEGGGWGIAVGALAVIMGIVTLAWPAATGLAILYVIAAWAIISGIADIAGAFMGGISGGRRVWLVITGLLGIAVGIYFFVHPVTGVLALLWVVGVYLVALGILRIIAGFMPPPRPQAA
ncbi:MAG: HdeD family acid-resistance protein [Deltaproteobacteria bacterium]